ncbi:MAG: hypothetical protein AAGI45_05470 [Cyanobacteria bacterium P01_H01_bin.26]
MRLNDKAFLAPLKAYKVDKLVYVDEPGSRDTLDYEYGWCAASKQFYG